MYDHRTETSYYRALAVEMRARAVLVRMEAEKKASALERDADRKDQLASHICRLCAGAGATCCGD